MRKYLQTLSKVLYARGWTHSRSDPISPLDSHISPPAPPETQSLIRKTKSIINPPIKAPDDSKKNEPVKNKESIVTRGPRASTIDQLFATADRGINKPNNKITVVGAGDVGISTVFSLLAKGVTNHISMIDFSEEKLKGELMDFQSASRFLPHAKLSASKDYAISADSKICVLTPCLVAGSEGKSQDGIRCNAAILKAIIPQLLQHSPDSVLLVALDPVDVFTHLAWQMSDLPKGRVLGYGTNLSSATFRTLLSDRLGLAPSACTGYLIGENGDSSVPVWSGVTVGGVFLKDLNPDIGTEADPENWQEIHQLVMQSTQEICELKGNNSYATALSITDLCSAILNDTNCVRPVSTYVKGEHDIEKEVFLSLPCVLGSSGVVDIVRQPLSALETELLHQSADVVAQVMGNVETPQ